MPSVAYTGAGSSCEAFVPVTAKLSRKFYETFGDQIANELVEWFNQVDLTYRSDLRDLNESNFARFDAKLEQRVAELRAEMQEGFARADAKLEQRVAQLDAKIDRVAAELDLKVQTGFARLETALAAQRADLIKWMFLFWAGTALTVIGLHLS